jgi:hypothetical protein
MFNYGTFGGKLFGVYLERFTVDEDLLDILTANVNVFDLLGHDVFALRELEYVLLPVNDL